MNAATSAFLFFMPFFMSTMAFYMFRKILGVFLRAGIVDVRYD